MTLHRIYIMRISVHNTGIIDIIFISWQGSIFQIEKQSIFFVSDKCELGNVWKSPIFPGGTCLFKLCPQNLWRSIFVLTYNFQYRKQGWKNMRGQSFSMTEKLKSQRIFGDKLQSFKSADVIICSVLVILQIFETVYILPFFSINRFD